MEGRWFTSAVRLRWLKIIECTLINQLEYLRCLCMSTSDVHPSATKHKIYTGVVFEVCRQFCGKARETGNRSEFQNKTNLKNENVILDLSWLGNNTADNTVVHYHNNSLIFEVHKHYISYDSKHPFYKWWRTENMARLLRFWIKHSTQSGRTNPSSRNHAGGREDRPETMAESSPYGFSLPLHPAPPNREFCKKSVFNFWHYSHSITSSIATGQLR